MTKEASADITSDGLLSFNYLQIDPGPASADPLAPGSTIQGTTGAGLMEALGGLGELSGQTSSLLAQLGGLVDELSASVEPMLARIELLLSAENLESFSGTLAALRALAEETRPRTNRLLEHLHSWTKALGICP